METSKIVEAGLCVSEQEHARRIALADEAIIACREVAIDMVRETLAAEGIDWPDKEERYRKEWYGRVCAKLEEERKP